MPYWFTKLALTSPQLAASQTAVTMVTRGAGSDTKKCVGHPYVTIQTLSLFIMFD